jgi:hypothetical protein
MIISLNNISEKGWMRSDRIQLFTASIVYLPGLLTRLKVLTEYLAIPYSAFIIAIVNIIMAIGYNRFGKKYGHKFDITILRINGIVMLITV